MQVAEALRHRTALKDKTNQARCKYLENSELDFVEARDRSLKYFGLLVNTKTLVALINKSKVVGVLDFPTLRLNVFASLKDCPQEFKYESVTPSQALAERDAMRLLIDVMRRLGAKALEANERHTSKEIKKVSTIPLRAHNEQEALLRRLMRVMDCRIQEANWKVSVGEWSFEDLADTIQLP